MQSRSPQFSVKAVAGMPLVRPGDDIAELILDALAGMGERLSDRDVLVVTHKIVSKAEGRLIDLACVKPSDEARELAFRLKKDARLVEMVLRESNEVVRVGPNVIITEHRLGHVSANAGVDVSNVEQPEGKEVVLCLPFDPDGSADRIRKRLREATGATVGVIVSDSAGRAWRRGLMAIAIGISGVPAVLDLRGQPDLFDYRLRVTEIAFSDLIASAAHLVIGEAAEGTPVALVRGLEFQPGESSARRLLRPKHEDLFR